MLQTKLGGPSSVSATEQQEAEAREHQMQLLRQKCVPALVFLLVRVLNSSGEEARCIRVADLVASERYQLYKVRQTASRLPRFRRHCCI